MGHWCFTALFRACGIIPATSALTHNINETNCTLRQPAASLGTNARMRLDFYSTLFLWQARVDHPCFGPSSPHEDFVSTLCAGVHPHYNGSSGAVRRSDSCGSSRRLAALTFGVFPWPTTPSLHHSTTPSALQFVATRCKSTNGCVRTGNSGFPSLRALRVLLFKPLLHSLSSVLSSVGPAKVEGPAEEDAFWIPPSFPSV